MLISCIGRGLVKRTVLVSLSVRYRAVEMTIIRPDIFII